MILGDYVLSVSKTGYDSRSISVTVIEDETSSESVTLEQSISSLTIIVKDMNGNPLDASISSISQPSGQSTLNAETGSDGSSTFNEIKPGQYSLLISCEDYESHRETGLTCVASETLERTILLEQIGSDPEPEPELEEPEPEEPPSDATNSGIPSYPLMSIIAGVGLFLYLRRWT